MSISELRNSRKVLVFLGEGLEVLELCGRSSLTTLRPQSPAVRAVS